MLRDEIWRRKRDLLSAQGNISFYFSPLCMEENVFSFVQQSSILLKIFLLNWKLSLSKKKIKNVGLKAVSYKGANLRTNELSYCIFFASSLIGVYVLAQFQKYLKSNDVFVNSVSALDRFT